jgi:hypothetical protein
MVDRIEAGIVPTKKYKYNQCPMLRDGLSLTRGVKKADTAERAKILREAQH